MDWERLAQAVIDRRVELGYRTREAFAEGTGLSSRLLGDLEKARRDNFDHVTLARLEQALQWKSGTARAILTAVPDRDEADPLDAKLDRLKVTALGLNPSDLRRLNANVQTLIEWAGSVSGRPEPSPEDVAALEQFQRTVNAANDRQRTVADVNRRQAQQGIDSHERTFYQAKG